MQIVFNGQPRQTADGMTVAALLHELQLAGKPLAVEVNFQLVPREEHEERVLHEGDQLEVVTLAGGG